MKPFFRFFRLLLTFLLPTTVTANAFVVDGLYYNINNNEATVTYSPSSFTLA